MSEQRDDCEEPLMLAHGVVPDDDVVKDKHNDEKAVYKSEHSKVGLEVTQESLASARPYLLQH